MRGYKRTPKKKYSSDLFQTVTENGKVTRLTVNLELLARQQGYTSIEEFMLQSDFLDRFNELKKHYQNVRIYKGPFVKAPT